MNLFYSPIYLDANDEKMSYKYVRDDNEILIMHESNCPVKILLTFPYLDRISKDIIKKFVKKEV